MIRLRFIIHTLVVLGLVSAGIYYAAIDEYRIGTVLELLAIAVLFWSDR